MTTPNSDVIYAMSYVDLGKDGPLVFEAPPNLQGILLDFWQRPIPVDGGNFFGDVGLPGPDAGKGGNFWSVTLYEAENFRSGQRPAVAPSWVCATSRRSSTPTAARTSTSGRKRLRAKRATGSPPDQAEGISPS